MTLNIKRNRHCALGLAAILAAAFASSAQAKKTKAEVRPVAVLAFSGQGAGAIRGEVISAISDKEGYEVVSSKELTQAIRKVKRMSKAADYQRVATDLHAVAFVQGHVSKERRQWIVSLTLRNGADGEVLNHASWSSRTISALNPRVRRNFWPEFGEELEAATPPFTGKPLRPGSNKAPIAKETTKPKEVEAQPKPKVETKPKVEAKAKETSKTKQVAPAETEAAPMPPADEVAEGAPAEPKVDSYGDDTEVPPSDNPSEAPDKDALTESIVRLDAEIGILGFFRWLRYQERAAGALPRYTIGPGPGVYLNVDVYPGAILGEQGVPANLGLNLEYERGLFIESGTTADGVAFDTSYDAFAFGLRYRFAFDAWEVIPLAGLFIQRFSVEDAGETPSNVPAVSYQGMRLGVGARVAVAPKIAVTADAAYRFVFSEGPIGEDAYFPRASAWGLDLGLGGAYAISGPIELRLTLGLRSFGVSPNSQAEDAVRAGAVRDTYVYGQLGVAYRWMAGPNPKPLMKN